MPKNKTLRDYFPMIRTREEVLDIIQSTPGIRTFFHSQPENEQELFLDICTGMRGAKVLYDSFFKEVMSPEISPERLNDFLTSLLGQPVEIHTLLQPDSPRLADEKSLLIMDIVVRLKDGSLANVEMQKIPYDFPAERSACYSSDLMLRQYRYLVKRSNSQKKKFKFQSLKSVYTIVLFEKSISSFHGFPDIYLHRFHQTSDSGLQMDLLQKYFFIPLDIFKEIMHNKGINNKLEAWLTFFACDAPGDILKLLEAYPEFVPLYKDIYTICLNIEGVMNMFWDYLREGDRMAIDAMIEDREEEVKRLDTELKKIKATLKHTASELQKKGSELQQKGSELQQKDSELRQKSSELQQKDSELQQKDSELQQKSSELQQKDSELQQKSSELQQKDSELQQKSSELQQKDSELQQKDSELQQKDSRIAVLEAELARLRQQ